MSLTALALLAPQPAPFLVFFARHPVPRRSVHSASLRFRFAGVYYFFLPQVAELEARLAAVAGQKREPSERERELERRLQSLTDHLIQKQAQVEALASEKATLALRLEVRESRVLLASSLRMTCSVCKMERKADLLCSCFEAFTCCSLRIQIRRFGFQRVCDTLQPRL